MSQPSPAKKHFANAHPSDRTFYLVMLLLVWAAILSGFIYDIVTLKAQGRLYFPWITHVHAAFYVGWLVLFTVQVLLIRSRNLALHKKLGLTGTALVPAMVIAGVVVAISSEARKFGTPFADTAFISIMLCDMVVFGVIAGAGIYLRKQPAAHKRLILIATIGLTDAGFGRWLSIKIVPWFGNVYWSYHSFSEGFLPFFAFQMMWPLLLILAVGVYDLFTRKSLHPVYLPALAWWLLFNLLEGWLYFSPGWMQLAKKMIGH